MPFWHDSKMRHIGILCVIASVILTHRKPNWHFMICEI
jgi:hypothetical protein